jgi:hypothetical protein
VFAATSCDAAAPNTSGSNRFSCGSWPDTAAWREAQALRQVWAAVDGEMVKDRQEIGSCFVGQMRRSSSEGIDENEKRRVDRVHAQEKSFGL